MEIFDKFRHLHPSTPFIRNAAFANPKVGHATDVPVCQLFVDCGATIMQMDRPGGEGGRWVTR